MATAVNLERVMRRGNAKLGKEHVRHVGIEVLTGVAAGDRDGSGEFPPGSVYSLVEKQLRKYARTRKDFGATQPPQTEQGDSS